MTTLWPCHWKLTDLPAQIPLPPNLCTEPWTSQKSPSSIKLPTNRLSSRSVLPSLQNLVTTTSRSPGAQKLRTTHTSSTPLLSFTSARSRIPLGVRPSTGPLTRMCRSSLMASRGRITRRLEVWGIWRCTQALTIGKGKTKQL